MVGPLLYAVVRWYRRFSPLHRGRRAETRGEPCLVTGSGQLHFYPVAREPGGLHAGSDRCCARPIQASHWALKAATFNVLR